MFYCFCQLIRLQSSAMPLFKPFSSRWKPSLDACKFKFTCNSQYFCRETWRYISFLQKKSSHNLILLFSKQGTCVFCSKKPNPVEPAAGFSIEIPSSFFSVKTARRTRTWAQKERLSLEDDDQGVSYHLHNVFRAHIFSKFSKVRSVFRNELLNSLM